VASPHFKTGRYSKDLPTNLAADYEEARRDKKLLELRSEIALSDARCRDLLRRVDSGESGALWRAARKAFQDFQNARGDVAKMSDALDRLSACLQQGVSDYASWDEVGRCIDRKARLVESERKRQVENHQMISIDRAMLLVAAMVNVIERHVTDLPTRARIGGELARLIGEGDQSPDALDDLDADGQVN
jgi:hypothetical protein